MIYKSIVRVKNMWIRQLTFGMYRNTSARKVSTTWTQSKACFVRLCSVFQTF